jgi:hypothetical protein
MQAAGAAMGLPMDLDGVRRAKLRAVEDLTGRPLIIYAVDIANGQKTAQNPLLGLINFQDKDGFVEAMRGLAGPNLDVLIQSPGGLAEAAESIVALLRASFRNVRFIVPSFAKSAATMLALSGDELLMAASSELGPIDPQMPTGRGTYAPAQTIVDQFEEAKKELQADPSAMPAWLPILQQYGPSLLIECRNHQKLSEELVSKWLAAYMFRRRQDRDQHAGSVAAKLNDHNYWRSHARRVDLTWMLQPSVRLRVRDLGRTPALHEAVWALHHAINITFGASGAFKIVENGHGAALIGMAQVQQLVLPIQLAPQLQPPPQPVLPLQP